MSKISVELWFGIEVSEVQAKFVKCINCSQVSSLNRILDLYDYEESSGLAKAGCWFESRKLGFCILGFV